MPSERGLLDLTMLKAALITVLVGGTDLGRQLWQCRSLV